jgi:hypothetical protein
MQRDDGGYDSGPPGRMMLEGFTSGERTEGDENIQKRLRAFEGSGAHQAQSINTGRFV